MSVEVGIGRNPLVAPCHVISPVKEDPSQKHKSWLPSPRMTQGENPHPHCNPMTPVSPVSSKSASRNGQRLNCQCSELGPSCRSRAKCIQSKLQGVSRMPLESVFQRDRCFAPLTQGRGQQVFVKLWSSNVQTKNEIEKKMFAIQMKQN